VCVKKFVFFSFNAYFFTFTFEDKCSGQLGRQSEGHGFECQSNKQINIMTGKVGIHIQCSEQFVLYKGHYSVQ